MKTSLTLAFAASALLLGACHDAPESATPHTAGETRSAPPAPSMANTPAVAPPISGGPTEAPPPVAATAKDSPATNPMATLTKEKESNAMPMAGQANNHSSDSLDPKKAPAAAR